MDLGAHPMYLSRWMLGKPKRIQSMFNCRTGWQVEDNAVCTIEFENKAICLSETSLVSPMTPAILEVYGTNGVILAEGASLRMRTKGMDDWTTPELPENLPKPIRQWLDAIEKGTPVLFDEQAGRDLTELMEKAYMADKAAETIAF